MQAPTAEEYMRVTTLDARETAALHARVRMLHKERDTARKERDEVRRELETQEGRADFWKEEIRRCENVLVKAEIISFAGDVHAGVVKLVSLWQEAKSEGLRMAYGVPENTQLRADLVKACLERDDFRARWDRVVASLMEARTERDDFKMKWENTVEELAKIYKKQEDSYTECGEK